jgi:glycosyltransferase involved in cell wall biosynthesis
MVNVVINCLSALSGGGQTNIINLLNYFPKNGYKFILIANSKNIELLSNYKSFNIEIVESKFASKNIISRLLWEKFILPFKLKKWFCSIYYSPGGSLITNVPQGIVGITTLQNMLPFEEIERKRFPIYSFLRYKLLFLKYIFIYSYKNSDKIIFISKYSRDVIKKIIPDIENKSTIIPLGISENFLKSKLNYKLPDVLIDEDFYLYVSQFDYYKSQKEIIYSWKSLVDKGFRRKLVLVGSKFNKYGDESLSLIKELNLENFVIYLGFVKYQELPSLYKSAFSLIFASTCECCPNTLLEMLSFKKPIFCSNWGPMPEFGEDGVIYFDPHLKNDLIEKILNLHHNPSLIKSYSEKSFILSKKYNFEQTILKNINYILK